MTTDPYLMNLKPYSVTLVKYSNYQKFLGETFTILPGEAVKESDLLIDDPNDPAYNAPLIQQYLDNSILCRIMFKALKIVEEPRA
jgi:L,D-peptidoglycan transpeptidase YkuD (ErfK/YbiS/YcfS/YnhG family)